MQQMQTIGPHRSSGSRRKVYVRKAMRPDVSVLMGSDTVVNAEGRLFRDHSQLNGLQDFCVILDVDLVFTDLPQRTLGQFNLGIGHFNTSSGNGFSDIAGAYRAEQFTLVARIGADGDAQFRQLRGARFRFSFLSGSGRFQFGTALFKLPHVLRGRADRLPLRQQKVTAETRFHYHLVADIAQFTYFFEQDYVHLVYPQLSQSMQRAAKLQAWA